MVDDPLRALGARQREVDSLAREDASMPAELRELLRPFEGDERAELLDGVLARLDASSEASPTEPGPASADVSVAEGPPIDLGSKRRRSGWIGVVAAAAAALLLWLGLRPDPSVRDTMVLPSYRASQLDGGARTMRSGDGAVPSRLELGPDDRIEWTFTPRTPVREPVAAVLLATPPHGDARLTPLAAAQVSDQGVVHVAGSLDQFVRLSPGPWHITVIIGAADSLPSTAREAADPGPWEHVEFDLDITSPRSP